MRRLRNPRVLWTGTGVCEGVQYGSASPGRIKEEGRNEEKRILRHLSG